MKANQSVKHILDLIKEKQISFSIAIISIILTAMALESKEIIKEEYGSD